MNTTATAMAKFEDAYNAMIETCNFPNIKRVVIKPQGASAEYDMALTGKSENDIAVIRQHKELGDQVTVYYVVRDETLKHPYNRPVRAQATSKRHDHSVKGALAWNNAGSYLVRYHEPKKSLQVLPLRKTVSGHELGQFLADLHANKSVRRAMVDDTILSDAQLTKIAAYVNGDKQSGAVPAKQDSPVIPSVAQKSDLDIVHYDADKTEINKYRWVYIKLRGGMGVTLDPSTMAAIEAATGAKISRFHAKESFVIRTPQNREPISREALQAILYTNPVASATPAQALPESAPVVTPAPAATTPDAAMIAAIVAQVMAAMQAAK